MILKKDNKNIQTKVLWKVDFENSNHSNIIISNELDGNTLNEMEYDFGEVVCLRKCYNAGDYGKYTMTLYTNGKENVEYIVCPTRNEEMAMYSISHLYALAIDF